MAALIGALRVSLSADTARFEQGMKRAQRQAQTSAGAISKSMGHIKAGLAGLVSGLSIGLLTNVIKGALDYAGSLGEVSQQLGVTTRDLQVFRYAASQNGVSTEEMDKGLGKLTVTLGQVAAGAKAPTKALEAIGVTAQELAGKSTGEAFRIIADGLAKVQDRAQRAAVEVALFGRTGAKLDTLLSGGSARINELSEAADRLGIVLSDEQIQRADDTADKLEAIKTVLQARLAGVVADNADAILSLANALAEIVNVAGRVIRAMAGIGEAIASIPQPPAWVMALAGGPAAQAGFGLGSLLGAGQQPGRSQTIKLGPARPASKPQPTGNINRFLAGGGGGGRKRGGGGGNAAEKAERDRLQALRDANQIDQEIRRAKIDVLQATRDLATDEVERYQISIDIKDAERAAFASQLEYEVAAKERTKAQAEALQIEYDRKDQLERQKLIEEENHRAFEDSARLDSVSLEIQRDVLQSEAQNAETAKEQREIQLRILDLNYQIEKARLETVLADQQSSEAAKEEARRRLNALPSMQKQDQKAVVAGTRGPLEDYMSQLPTTTEKWNEALENVAANGLKSVEDGIVDVLTGAKSVGEALQDILGDIIKDLIRIGVRKMIGSVIGGGFAEGGYTGAGGKYEPAGIVHRKEFVFDSAATSRLGVPFLEALRNGKAPGMAAGGYVMPIPRMQPSSRVNYDNDNMGVMRGGDSFTFTFPGVTNAREARQSGLQAASAFRQAVGRSARVNG